MKKLRILSLGAGVQSSTLALMIEKGEIENVSAAIFADVLRGLNEQQQPQGGVPQAGATDGAGTGMDGSGGVPVGANPTDDSGVGGGNIGTGNTPLAGEAGFTGNIAEAAE